MARYIRGQRGWIGPAIAAGASLLGGLMSKSGADKANETNIELANTAYQRRVKDLHAAGLNPMLAYTQGGAGAPQITNAAGQGVSSAQQAGQTAAGFQQMANIAAQTDLLKAQTKKAAAEAEVATASIHPDQQSRVAAATSAQAVAKWADLSEEEKVRILKQQERGMQQDLRLKQGTFESDVKQRKAEALLRELAVSEGKAGSKFWDQMEDKPLILKLLMQIVGGGMSSAKDFSSIYHRR